MCPQKVGDKIAELRKNKNITQKQLASALSVTNKAISRWENGDGLPDISNLPKLAKALGVSIDEIINHSFR